MLEQIKIAEINDLPGVISLYKAICDHQSQDQYGANWTWGEYPSEESLTENIQKKQLVIGLQDGKVIAGGVVTIGEDYPQVDWPTPATENEIGVLHLLGVHPDYRGTGISSQIVGAVQNHAKKLGLKVLHLDVLANNVPAEKLYQKNGFKLVKSLTLHFDDIGDQLAKVMEYSI
ncbi:GNAT family N-acetyltransferase [Lactobacillaceae bacterium 24-114]